MAGGGLTGIETATELAEAYPGPRIELACAGRVGGWLSARAQRHLRWAFERMSLGVREGSRIAKVGPDSLLLDDGRSLHADVIVWAAGFRVPALAAAVGLAADEHGRMIVDDRLRSVSHPEVYGIGDAAAAPTPGGAAGSAMSGRTSALAVATASHSSPAPTTARSASCSPTGPRHDSKRRSPAAPPGWPSDDVDDHVIT